MRQIDKTGTVETLISAVGCDNSAQLDQLSFKFNNALENSRGSFEPHGIKMCLADEALPSIVKAYKGLSVKVSPAVFAEAIATELDLFARTFPDNENPLTYPHFLIHGIGVSTLPEVIDKLRDNVRIIRQTVPEDLISKRIAVPGVGTMFFRNGSGDDFHGHSFTLFSNGTSEEAKVGCFFDLDKKVVYILNVQRRRLYTHPAKETETNAVRKVRQLSAHREFLKMCEKLDGKDPREFLISNLIDLSREAGFVSIRGIKSEAHPMAIAGHPGFKASYDQYFRNAGISEDLGIYLGLELS